MRNVEAHLMGDKIEEAVTHYINSHQPNETVHVDSNALSLNVQDDCRVVTVMNPQNFSAQLSRQVSLGEQIGDGPWVEELLDGRLAALMAHLAQPTRTSHHQGHQKMTTVRSDVDGSVILDTPMRMFNGQTNLENGTILTEEDSEVLVMTTSALNKQSNKKSLPHKKRISKKLKRTAGSSTPTQQAHNQNDIIVIHCSDEQQEEILPDSFVDSLRRHTTSEQMTEPSHVTHEMRPILICQVCGEFYGEEQLKFYQHLKQHYEPQASIIIENPIVPDIAMDKMTNSCIVDNVQTLPDSIVELSLENTVPKAMYPSMDNMHKHILYSSSDKTLYNSNKVQYSMALDKEVPPDMDDTLDKLELYCCVKCNKSFRKQKQCEMHIKEVHSNPKLEDMAEFSDPEDLMEGIHVAVEEEPAADYEGVQLPHITVENGHVHQHHVRHWYSRTGAESPSGAMSMCACGGGGYCDVCAPPSLQPDHSLQPAPSHIHPHSQSLTIQTSHSNTQPHNIEHTHTQPENAHPSHSHVHEHISSSTTHIQPSHSHTQSSQLHSSQPHSQQLQVTSPRQSPPPSPPRMKGCQVMVTRDDVLQRILELQNDEPEKAKEKKSDEARDPSQASDTKQKAKKTEKKFECAECGLVFRHRNSLMYHMHKHRERQQECEHCGKRFYTVTALKIHVRAHEGVKPCVCTVCGQHFRQSSDLKYHIASKHSTTKEFKCEFCDKEFARRYSLNLHRRIHTGEKNYPCGLCDKSFRASSYRLVHMRIHTGTKPFKCPHCDKCFRVAYDMRRHVRVVHEKHKPPQIKQEKELEDRTKQKPAKRSKKPPNVTVQNTSGEFKEFDGEIFKYKFKEVYPEPEKPDAKDKRLRSDSERIVFRDNTDGKMPVFSQIEKPSYSVSNLVTISDIKSLEVSRERDADCVENGFFDKLAFYNISAV
ncbi:uncharacterized protein LOC126975827 [Leptidea sinapis]|uniref:uncharacterized protein LOC126975827 n=1 Tax=Leptidea sinapis TaxID=189913 RepID=UPI002127A8BE|nr:uncharacterized protein LOC126975827 [Leptidea sinapis]